MASAQNLAELAETLCESSRRTFKNVYQHLDWPAQVDPEADWFTSPELVSIYGSELWQALGEPARKRLAFWEAVNFYSLNIRGESALIQGLGARLYRSPQASVTSYLHHFLDEENQHSFLFGSFCQRYGGKVYQDRKVWAGERSYQEGEEDLLFFARVLIFEEIVDRFNLSMSKDERLHPIARAINLNHHLEEARHLAFGRQLVRRLWERHAPGWSAETVAGVREYLRQFLKTSWREYYNPEVYEDAAVLQEAPRPGLRHVWDLQEQAWSSPAAVTLRRSYTERCAKSLRESGILEEVNAP